MFIAALLLAAPNPAYGPLMDPAPTGRACPIPSAGMVRYGLEAYSSADMQNTTGPTITRCISARMRLDRQYRVSRRSRRR
jgi:hypothetical protein